MLFLSSQVRNLDTVHAITQLSNGFALELFTIEKYVLVKLVLRCFVKNVIYYIPEFTCRHFFSIWLLDSWEQKFFRHFASSFDADWPRDNQLIEYSIHTVIVFRVHLK